MTLRLSLMAIALMLCRPPCSDAAQDAIASGLDHVRTSLLAIQKEAPGEL
jgi:hypothetical protein